MSLGSGSIEVITGCMFAGKTEECIGRIKRAVIADQVVFVFKPAIDNRFDDVKICSHDNNRYRATPLTKIGDFWQELGYLEDESLARAEVVVFEEAQFFNDGLIAVCQRLVKVGVRIIIAGLDTDFLGRPFGAMPELMAIADKVDKLHAICAVCKGEACMTQRLVDGQPAKHSDPLILVGASESYEARCRKCHQIAEG